MHPQCRKEPTEVYDAASQSARLPPTAGNLGGQNPGEAIVIRAWRAIVVSALAFWALPALAAELAALGGRFARSQFERDFRAPFVESQRCQPQSCSKPRRARTGCRHAT